MKNLKKVITLLMVILLSLSTFQTSIGQENDNANSKFGLGVSLFNITEFDLDQANSIYFTINFGSKFRLEPKVGFVLSDGFEQYSIGIGAFGIKPISKFNTLYGLRLGLSTDAVVSVSPTVGGEYYFIKNFSLGSEVQLQGLFKDGDFGVFTNASVIIRFYF
jgi:hypothetical protein